MRTGWGARSSGALWAVACGLVLAAGSVGAQEPLAQDTLAPTFGQIDPHVDLLPKVPRTMPGSSAGSPTAYGPSWNDGYVGVGFAHRARYMPERPFNEILDGSDGAVAVGFGLGDAKDFVGLDINIASYTTFRRGLFRRWGISFKLHRILGGNWGLAAGYENAITHGGVDSDPSLYVVGSKIWQNDDWNPFHSITASLGYGNGRFRFEEDVFADRDTWNWFGSIGFQIMQPVSLIADWTGQDLVLAASIVPFQLPFVPDDLQGISLVVTPGFADVTGRAGDGVRFIVGIGLGFHWDSLGEIFP